MYAMLKYVSFYTLFYILFCVKIYSLFYIVFRILFYSVAGPGGWWIG